MKKITVLMFAFFGLCIMSAPVTYAEEYPCKKDIAKFCKDIEPGDGQILRCLTLSEKKLSGPCKKNLEQIEKAVEEIHNECADDYAIFCSSILPGEGRIAACLDKNKKILTPKCKAILQEVMQKAREIQEEMKNK